MTTSKAPGQAGTAGGAGPEQNLHLDHDAALEALGTAPTASRLDQARDAVTGAAGAVGDTVSQVADQARQVAGQARDAAGQAREAVTDAVSGARDRAQTLYEDARHGVRQARTGARDAYEAGTERFDDLRTRGYDAAASGRDSVERFVQENPLLVGVVGLAAGLLLGALLPRTRRENETIGRWADGYREDGVRYAREATLRGRQFVDRTVADIGGQVREARDDLREPVRGAPSNRRTGPSGRYQNH